MTRIYGDDTRRFWSKVVRGEEGECWPFVGVIDAHGYGKFDKPGRPVLAHRFAYELVVGTIPAGLCVLHQCDNPPCANPTHLWLGTQRENVEDCIAKGRFKPGKLQGEAKPSAKLKDDDVRLIRRLAREGMPKIQIARQVGISRAVVQYILAGRTWTHVVG